jgi:hypothetical protein
MDPKQVVTRRSLLAKGMAAGVAAMGLGALARPAATRAKPAIPPTTQSADTTCKVFCDDNGKNCKRCCWDKYGYPEGCTPIKEPVRRKGTPRK